VIRELAIVAAGAGLFALAARTYAAYGPSNAGDVALDLPPLDPFAGWPGTGPEYSDAGAALDQEQSLMSAAARALSVEGLNAIKKHEGLVLSVYRDQAGLPTIGYGHLIKPGESFGPITEAEASALLMRDVQVAIDAVNGVVTVPLSQSEFDALVSLAYNIGGGAFASSTLVRKLNAGDRAGATAEFVRWNKVRQGGALVDSAGLTNRRLAEARIFSGGAYA
jgi:lysozyme